MTLTVFELKSSKLYTLMGAAGAVKALVEAVEALLSIHSFHDWILISLTEQKLHTF
jgi:hypothetical protein